MGSKGLLTALLVVAAIILAASFARKRSGETFRPIPVMTCAATYAEPPLKEGFRPLPVSTCGPYGDYYGVDMTGLRASPRDAAGTVTWDPYSTQSRVSLERTAESPEVAEAPNPVTGLGRTSALRAMGDRYRRNEALTRLSVFDVQPGEPGYMEEVGDTHAMSLMAVVARRSPPAANGAPACLLSGTDVEPDFFTDGYFGDQVILEPRGAPARRVKEGLTSTRGTAPNTLTASRVGLGSIRMDPRFEPGPESRTPDGNASWAPGDWAGGPTTGAYASSLFAVPSGWQWGEVHGFGDGSMWGRTYPVEAAVTGHSSW